MSALSAARAESPLIQSDALLAAIVRSSTDAIISKDLNSIIVSWNPGATRIFGFTAEEMIGKSIRTLIPDELQYEEDMILRRVKAGELLEAYETTRITASGELIPVSITVSPVRDDSGKIIGASKIARDLREKRAADALLRETEWRLHMLADNMSQFAWMAEPDGSVIWYNKRWYEYTGTRFEDMRGWGWQKVHHPDHVDRVSEHFRNCCAAGVEWEDVFPLRGADGQYRWFLSRAVPLHDDSGKIVCWLGTNTDITEEREQREQIKLLMREVNHRSKNMLSMIQALARRTAPADHPEFVESFEDRLKALAANQELLVNRQWTGVQMEDLVRTQFYYVDDIFDSRVTMSGPRILIKPMPAETISMALHELVTNAAKYGALSNDSGTIEVRWDIENDIAGDRFVLRWRERGGPFVTHPQHEGFGSTVVNRVPRINLQAEVESRYLPEGFEWDLRCPISRVFED